MDTSKALEIIYRTVKKSHGDAKAREYVSLSVTDVIRDLQENHLEVTSSAIEKKLIEEAEFILECEKKQKTA